MKVSTLRPESHVLVCVNARRSDDPLRSGCGAAGPAVFTALKRAALDSGLGSRVWVTSTGCLGHCPRAGCSVVIHPQNVHLVEVTDGHVPAVVARALQPPTPPR